MTHFPLAGTHILMNQEDRVGMTRMVAREIAFQRSKSRQYNCPKALAADLKCISSFVSRSCVPQGGLS